MLKQPNEIQFGNITNVKSVTENITKEQRMTVQDNVKTDCRLLFTECQNSN